MASGEKGHGTELKHINIAWSYNIIFFKLSYAPQFLFLHFLLFFPLWFPKAEVCKLLYCTQQRSFLMQFFGQLQYAGSHLFLGYVICEENSLTFC